MRYDPQQFRPMWEFIGESIQVETAGEVSDPVSFQWREKQYDIEEVLLDWFDWGFSAGAQQRDWKSRRHRRYYRLRTCTGEVFEIYRDRKGKAAEGEWICLQRQRILNNSAE